MIRKFVVLALLSLAVAGWAGAVKPEAEPTITIMTQNMDDGTDLTYVIAALTEQVPGLTVPLAVDLTFAELLFSNFDVRVGLLAQEIADRKPDLVALQEAALWRTGPGPDLESVATVLYDNLDLLLSALTGLGVSYDVVAVNQLSDLALPGTSGEFLRFTDRNAVLVRSGPHPPGFILSNVQARAYDVGFPIAGLTIPAGWISADIEFGNKRFRFATTHLQSPIQGIPEATDVQLAQAKQLVQELRDARHPVVICGDFNSDANHGGFVDDTPAVGILEKAGLKEAWPATHPKTDLGLTWPFFLEDQFPAPPFFVSFSPIERIDLFFSRGVKALSTDLVVANAPGDPMPPYASDHAGVIAKFRP
jgi:endonuclease/exonuclease/phosphatase family metal-dependent hydrolase